MTASSTAFELLNRLSFRIATEVVKLREREAAVELFELMASQAGVTGFQLRELRDNLVPNAIDKILASRKR
jgi:hypothetical protein